MSNYRNAEDSYLQRLVDGGKNLIYGALASAALIGMPGCANLSGNNVGLQAENLYGQVRRDNPDEETVGTLLDSIVRHSQQLSDTSKESITTKVDKFRKDYKSGNHKENMAPENLNPNHVDFTGLEGRKLDDDYSSKLISDIVVTYDTKGNIKTVEYDMKVSGAYVHTDKKGDSEEVPINEFVRTTITFEKKGENIEGVATLSYRGRNIDNEPKLEIAVHLEQDGAIQQQLFIDSFTWNVPEVPESYENKGINMVFKQAHPADSRFTDNYLEGKNIAEHVLALSTVAPKVWEGTLAKPAEVLSNKEDEKITSLYTLAKTKDGKYVLLTKSTSDESKTVDRVVTDFRTSPTKVEELLQGNSLWGKPKVETPTKEDEEGAEGGERSPEGSKKKDDDRGK